MEQLGEYTQFLPLDKRHSVTLMSIVMSRRALPVDWSMIQALYFQGVKPAELAEKFKVHRSAIVARITRQGWVGQREECRQLAKAAATAPLVDDMQSVSARFRQWFERDIEKVMDRLVILSPTNMPIRELQTRHDVVKGIYTMVAEMFDWTGEASKSPINSHLLAKLLDEVEIIREKKAEAIDVPPAPQPGVESEPQIDPQLEQIPEAVQVEEVIDSEKRT